MDQTSAVIAATRPLAPTPAVKRPAAPTTTLSSGAAETSMSGIRLAAPTISSRETEGNVTKLPAIAIGKSTTAEMKTPLKEREAAAAVKPQSMNGLSKAIAHSSSSDSPVREVLLSPVDRELSEADLRMEIGLENLGNTCFMNSSLQCLLHIHPLVSYFLAKNVQNDISRRSSKKGVVAVSFANLAREIFGSNGSAVAPVQFKRAVSKLAPYLLDHQQQDCQEFLRFLLDGMSEDLCRREPPAAMQASSEGPAAAGSVGKLRSAVSASEAGGLDMALAGSLRIGTERDDCSEDVQRISPERNKQQAALAAVMEDDTAPSKHRVRKVISANKSKQEDAAGDSWVGGGGLPSIKSAASPPSEAADSAIKELDAQQVLRAAKAAWAGYLSSNESIVTDIFAGLLQSTIECLSCSHRSLSFDPFIDLSLPIPKSIEEQSSGQEPRATPGKRVSAFSFRRPGPAPKCSLEDCFGTFSSEEILDGEDMFSCEKCRAKRRCSKRLSVFKYPKVLILQIKRFRFTAMSRDKLNTDVAFPVASLDISPYLSVDRPVPVAGSTSACYDLVGASHHTGSLSGGHYTAHVNTCPRQGAGAGADRWMCFNDAMVTPSDCVGGSSAYVLFYALRGDDPLALEQ